MVYGDGTVTDVACKGLNGMRMGDRTLTVRRATEVMCLFFSSLMQVACSQRLQACLTTERFQSEEQQR